MAKLPTWQAQDLNSTLYEVERRLKPLCSEKEYQDFLKSKEDFLSSENVDELHKKLSDFCEAHGDTWFQKLWDDMYLTWRSPLPLEMNFFLELDHHDLNKAIQGIVRFIYLHQEGTYPNESKRGVAQCMDPFTRMFSTRVPKLEKDELYLSPLEGKVKAIVMYKGAMTEICFDKDPSSASIKAALDEISSGSLDMLNLGSITTLPRDEAANLWDEILKTPSNCDTYERLKKAHFIICLDEDPSDGHVHQSFLSGLSTNRFFDKSLQLIYSSGKLGLNIEHTPCDAGPWLSLCEAISKERELSIEEGTEINSSPLHWDLSQEMEKKLHKAHHDHHEKAGSIEYHSIALDHLGKNSVKKLGISPDAFFQLSFQIALWETFKQRHSTYESVSMRHFLYGRTECMRPGTEEAFTLAEGFFASSVDERLDLIKLAAKAHVDRIKLCQQNQGGEKHLFAFKKMLENPSYEGSLAVLKSPALDKLMYDKLSTSNSSSPFIRAFGFGPVVDDGIGIGYTINDETTHLSITYKKDYHKEGALFIDSLNKVLKAMQETLSN